MAYTIVRTLLAKVLSWHFQLLQSAKRLRTVALRTSSIMNTRYVLLFKFTARHLLSTEQRSKIKLKDFSTRHRTSRQAYALRPATIHYRPLTSEKWEFKRGPTWNTRCAVSLMNNFIAVTRSRCNVEVVVCWGVPTDPCWHNVAGHQQEEEHYAGNNHSGSFSQL